MFSSPLPLSLALLAAALFLGVMIGPAGSWGAASSNIIWNVRMPRVVLAGIVGSLAPRSRIAGGIAGGLSVNG